MATNEIFRDADHLSLPVPAGTKAGTPVRVGSLNAVTETDVANVDGVAQFNADGSPNAAYNWGGGNPHGHASCWLKGAHEFTVDFAVENVGDPIYIEAGILADAGTTVFGHALSTKAAAAGPVVVRIAN